MTGRWDEVSNRWGVYRNTQSGWIAGVCAGIADRLSIKPVWVRLIFAILTATTHCVPGIIAYIALAFVLKPRAGLAAPASAAGVQMAYRDLAQSVSAPFGPDPAGRVTDLKSRFASLDARLNNLEAAVMSDELSLRRKFRDIGG